MRNKYPEQTLEQILSVSARLFIEKGYDKTSVQDIIEALGMSKGAVYHHFKSKEAILEAVMERRSAQAASLLTRLTQTTEAPNAREKLAKILEVLISDPETHSLDSVLIAQIKNPQFVVTGITDSVNKDAPAIARLLVEGTADGSITTDFPTECSEIFMLLMNIWLNPVLFARDFAATETRLRTLQQTMRLLGADIVSDQVLQKAAHRYSEMGRFQQKG